MALIGMPAMAQTNNLDVTSFGARGDALQMFVHTSSNSPVLTVQSTNRLGPSDMGKIILLFGVGPAISPTNNEDVVAQIVSVANGTNVTISTTAFVSAQQVPVTYGTQNSGPFQQCVDACAGTNTIVAVPPGRYLMVAPAMLNTNLNYAPTNGPWPTSVVIEKGGIHFQGTSPTNTTLLGCGAGIMVAGSMYRGWIFRLQGPVTNDAPLSFENLTFDGGIQQGRVSAHGVQWDVSHDAVVDAGPGPLHAYKAFSNCTFTHWRGEMIKSVTGLTDGFVLVTNCSFIDGEGSGFNFNFTHLISHCLFSNLFMAEEFWTGYMQGQSVFEDSTATNVLNAIVLVGALTNHAIPPYIVRGNTLAPTGTGMLLGPARNITITNNVFIGGNIGIGTDGMAYQGSGVNSNILIAANVFTNTGAPFNVGGGGIDLIEDVVISNNTAWNCGRFASGYGWNTNIYFLSNTSTGKQAGVLYSDELGGQWFIDDLSNAFPYFPVYDNAAPTNIVSYANGMRQSTIGAKTGAVFFVDDAHPAEVPPGATLLVQNPGQYVVKIVLSDTVAGAASAAVPVGSTATCAWQGSSWKLVSVANSVPAPVNLHVISVQ